MHGLGWALHVKIHMGTHKRIDGLTCAGSEDEAGGSFKDRISSEIISLMRERRSSRPGAVAKPLPAELDVPSSSSMTIHDTDENR